ncbi:MAG: glycosyltransferase [Eubacteriales bacterium]|nr:glycosyltransferase [Eubacteriales bacterium]
MKIAWFTPLDKKSAIGKVGVAVCEELAKHHSVDIWCYETEGTLETSLKVIHFNPSHLDIRTLSGYTHVIYNMGNYAGYHWAIYEALLQYPGIVILHDRTMYDFYKQYCAIQHPHDADGAHNAFSQMLYQEYGDMGVTALEQFSSLNLMEKVNQTVALPLMYSICRRATGIFTHSFAFAKLLKQYTLKPVSASYLPFQPEEKKMAVLPKSFIRDPDRLLIVSIGLVHPTKHTKELADVLVKHPDLRSRVQYVVIGDCGDPYGENLRKMANTVLNDSMFILGYQPYDVMYSFLQEADACVNLRYPNSEVCSLSLFEQMGFGKPVIAYSSGIYDEIPSDAICKIDMQMGEAALADMLHAMIADKESFRRIGEKAKQFIKKNCTLETYCSLLNEYLEALPSQSVRAAYNDAILWDLRQEMQVLGYNTLDIPDALDDIAYTVGSILDAQNVFPANPNTIGIWIGFPYEMPRLHQECAMKLMQRMVSAMLEYTPACFEIWCYSCNEAEVRYSLENLLQDERWAKRIKIVTEESWRQVLCVPVMDRVLPYPISIAADNLGTIAAQYSQACVFVPITLYLSNVIQTKRPLVIPALDMNVKLHYEEYTLQDSNNKFLSRDIESRVGRMVRRGAKAYSMSRSVKDQQIIPCIPGLKAEDVVPIWAADMAICDPDTHFSREILEQYHISNPYLFYPTQLRPQKNIETLMQAVELLYNEYPNLQIVLTGKLEDVPSVKKQWEKLRSYKNLVFVHDLTDQQLYTVYHYASCVPVPTLMEGGFPSQAIEALKQNIPTVLTDIDVVEERLEGCGFTAENCGLLLFKPEDATDMAAKLCTALTAPQKVLAAQKAFSEKFFQYTWRDAAEKYYQLLIAKKGSAESC